MPSESKISCFLSQLNTMKRDHQHAAIKELSKTFIRSSLEDLKSILRFLITIDDLELELKLFALLAASITNNAAHYEFIVLYNPLYDKLNSILNRGLSLKSTILLNFITALVYTDAESTSTRAQLTLHAKNMIRVSGCLRNLATFFMDTMMFPDTWKSLCQCVAECCREMKLNCDHCAHLIPVCIQKCFQGLLDAITVLNTLLDQNEKNLKKFIRSNGIKIFTRDNLQLTPCLQLLCTVVQNSPEAVSCLRNNGFSEEISQILEWTGPYSPNGQWCTIILYYINGEKPLHDVLLSSKTDKRLIEEHPLTKTTNLFKHTVSKPKGLNNSLNTEAHGANDTKMLFQNIMNEIQFCNTRDEGIKRKLSENRTKPNQIRQQINPPLNSDNKNEDHPVNANNTNIFEYAVSNQKGKNKKVYKNGNNTTKLFQNIMSEIQLCQTKDEREDITRILSENKTKPNRIRNIEMSINYDKNSPKMRLISEEPYNLGNNNLKHRFVDLANNDNEMSFSFLSRGDNNFDKSISTGTSKVSEKYQSNLSSSVKVTMAEKSCQVEPSFTNTNGTYPNNIFDNIENFAPAITSTPKNRNKPTHCNNAQFIPNLKIQTIKRTTTTETIKRSTTCLQANHNKLIEKRKLRKAQKKSPVVKKLTKRSISSRFLGALNESCTTIIKSVKDLFMSKQDTLKNDNKVKPLSSGHSFMDYMRQRDMATYNHNTNMDLSLGVKDYGCTTCDDTAMLKQKMQTDENLKRTIKKLKAGINTYGCNFKKISKTLWPQERYMTPTVLYNLYRKLILK